MCFFPESMEEYGFLSEKYSPNVSSFLSLKSCPTSNSLKNHTNPTFSESLMFPFLSVSNTSILVQVFLPFFKWWQWISYWSFWLCFLLAEIYHPLCCWINLPKSLPRFNPTLCSKVYCVLSSTTKSIKSEATYSQCSPQRNLNPS